MANELKTQEKPSTLIEVLESYQQAFESSLADSRINFESEIHFAYQALMNNSYLLDVAKKNPASLKNAIINIGAVGLTLNPVSQLAYLVPRRVNKQPAVCLDISYKGLVRSATESGSIMWAQAEIVYSNESVHLERLNEPPIHKRDLFAKEKGDIIGAYVVVKTAHDDYLTTHMTIEEIYEIRNKSEAFKKGMGPWREFESEMIKKTVVKRASKMWPRTPKIEVLEKAISVVNEHEGINFEERKEEIEENQKALDEDFPRVLSECVYGPKFRFTWGKFRGKQIKDCDPVEMEKYKKHLESKLETDQKYQYGEKYETYQKIKDYLDRVEVYTIRVREETLDELFSTGFEETDEFLDSLTEGEAQNIIEGKNDE